MAEKQFTDQEIIQAIIRSEGNVTDACAELGCSRVTFYRRKNDNPSIAAAFDTVREMEEGSLKDTFKKVIKDSSHKDWFSAARYYSRVHHGWRDTQQLDVTSGGQPITLVPVSQMESEDE